MILKIKNGVIIILKDNFPIFILYFWFAPLPVMYVAVLVFVNFVRHLDKKKLKLLIFSTTLTEVKSPIINVNPFE